MRVVQHSDSLGKAKKDALASFRTGRENKDGEEDDAPDDRRQLLEKYTAQNAATGGGQKKFENDGPEVLRLGGR